MQKKTLSDFRGAGNLLIQGDNLNALKALLPYCAGRDLTRQLVEKIRGES